MVSTDKAINPTNVMGATKRLAEIFVQSLWANQPVGPSSWRSASAMCSAPRAASCPSSRRQIGAGGPVKVTHPDMTRYFMTIPEAVRAGPAKRRPGTGGEIFVLDMGEPVKIVDLARQVIELSGLRPGEDIEIQFTGLRPGRSCSRNSVTRGRISCPPRIPRSCGLPPNLARWSNSKGTADPFCQRSGH